MAVARFEGSFTSTFCCLSDYGTVEVNRPPQL